MSRTETDTPHAPERLDEQAVRDRVRTGVALMAVRGAMLKAVGVVGTLVLAHLLAPREFGVIAVGISVMGVATFLGDAGLGSAFIQREAPPTRRELGAVVALQAAVAGVIAVVTSVAAVVAGSETIALAAVMAWSLPILSLRSAGQIVFERELRYRPQIMVEVAEVVAFNSCAIISVALGAGVWGVAAATYATALTSVTVMGLVSPLGLVLPSPRIRLLGGAWRFGAAFQAANLVTVLRDQVVNFGIAAIAGVTVLGLWTITFRLLAVPYLLFASLWRVSFPGMSRLLETGADPGPIIERSIGLSATVTGFLLSGLVGTAPVVVPAVLGSEWTGATTALPWACLGLMATPISTAAAGFLYAKGDAGTVLRTTSYQAVVLLAVGLGLLPSLGLTAIGLGWLAAHVVDGLVIGHRVKRLVDAAVVRPLLGPLLAAGVSAGLAWPLADAAPATVPYGVLIGLGVLAAYLGIHAVVARDQLVGTVRFVRRRR
jgi:O-antigen/teichoic acid export membrane protein